MKIGIASDHGGFELKKLVVSILEARGIGVLDKGCFGCEPCDYPDYAREVSLSVLSGEVDEGILICTMGLGMSMAANKYAGVRAALCVTEEMAKMARLHNNANVLVLGAKACSQEMQETILDKWLATKFEHVDRHARRVSMMDSLSDSTIELPAVHSEDIEVFDSIRSESERLSTTVNLIASENHVSRAVREAQGSVMTNKYAEGYPGDRWYKGCANVDDVERVAIDRACELFGAEHANVQPHCGSSANMSVYFSCLKPGDTVLAMDLKHGGHLTHGHGVNFSGRLFNFVGYGVSRETEMLDYDELAEVAKGCQPKLIVAGASSYPRLLDFGKFKEIAESVGALMMVDMAHIAGLVAGGCHPSPVDVSDFVTTTTHKTLRGPRSGMVLCTKEHAREVDKQIFPGIQGGPLMHSIAAKAVCFHEAMRPSFKGYAKQIIKNASAMAGAFMDEGLRLVSGGTDNHLVLIDVSAMGLTGRDAADELAKAGIVANKNVIPFDTNKPAVTSGLRIGTPAVTTRGMKEGDVVEIAKLMVKVLRNMGDSKVTDATREEVVEMTAAFPVS